MSSSVAQVVVWSLRVLLPILLFVLYTRASLPPLSSLFKKRRRSRGQLLAHRPTCGVEPACLASLRLVGPGEHPELFVKRGPKRRGRAEEEAKAAPKAAPTAAPTEEAAEASLESLLNYVAFNRTQTRVFLPDGTPPPPGPAPRRELPSADFVAKANLDAQSVLRAAVRYEKLETVTEVHQALLDAQVRPDLTTYSLLVRIAVSAEDLPQASELLMSMEQHGLEPAPELLDEVMALYAAHKRSADKGSTLSAAAPEFVPSGATEFIPLSAPAPAYAATSEFAPELAEDAYLPADAPPFVPAVREFVPGVVWASEEAGEIPAGWECDGWECDGAWEFCEEDEHVQKREDEEWLAAKRREWEAKSRVAGTWDDSWDWDQEWPSEWKWDEEPRRAVQKENKHGNTRRKEPRSAETTEAAPSKERGSQRKQWRPKTAA